MRPYLAFEKLSKDFFCISLTTVRQILLRLDHVNLLSLHRKYRIWGGKLVFLKPIHAATFVLISQKNLCKIMRSLDAEVS